MSKIKVLSPFVCNRIAAGEVVDRPYSVVKELVENSIDAGATEIEVHIDRGGKDMIKVIDNGCGIEAEDMRTAFCPHATSKISEVEDIDHIHTLGFRGEALASIAAVTHAELISAVEGEEANKVLCEDYYIGALQPAIAPKGTQITVTDLFYNTPVRSKFLKSDKKEEADVTNYMTRYILGNPEIAFKYFVDGKLRLQSYGGGLDEAITQVYGADYLPNCFKIKAERNDIKLSGFIGNQNFFKPNKTYQTLFLNGRYVINPIISSAITNAYSAYMMTKKFPFYVLFIEMPDDIVDVNVHPNKQDVRFTDNQLIYGTVYKIISTILDGSAKAADFVVSGGNKKDADLADAESGESADDAPSVSETKDVQKSLYAAEYTQTEMVYDKDFSDVVGIEKYKKTPPKPVRKNPLLEGFDLSPYEDYVPFDGQDQQSEPNLRLTDTFLVTEDKPEIFFKSDRTRVVNGEVLLPNYGRGMKCYSSQLELICDDPHYRGTLFNTYLLYEVRGEVIIIDQHAAHERLTFNKLVKSMREGQVAEQHMFIPFHFRVNANEKPFIDENLEAIRSMGFRIEVFGRMSYKVSAVPAYLRNMKIQEFFDDILKDVDSLKKLDVVDVLKEKLAQMACKHAVKGGDVLTADERNELFNMIDGNFGLKCPHGRPVCVKLQKSDLEKMFKRKV